MPIETYIRNYGHDSPIRRRYQTRRWEKEALPGAIDLAADGHDRGRHRFRPVRAVTSGLHPSGNRAGDQAPQIKVGRQAYRGPPMTVANMASPMALKYEHPLLAVRPREDRSGWYVEAWWTNRPSENIGHFATQSEARNWITLESTSYFVLREIDSMIKRHEHSTS
jgi:hypothetical protein